MPNQPATTNRPMRIGDDLWRDYGALTEAAGSNRSEVTRAFIEWYCGWPGAELPTPPGGGTRRQA